MTAQQDALAVYERAARNHRREAFLHHVAGRPLASYKEKKTAYRIERAMTAERENPVPA